MANVMNGSEKVTVKALFKFKASNNDEVWCYGNDFVDRLSSSRSLHEQQLQLGLLHSQPVAAATADPHPDRIPLPGHRLPGQLNALHLVRCRLDSGDDVLRPALRIRLQDQPGFS